MSVYFSLCICFSFRIQLVCVSLCMYVYLNRFALFDCVYMFISVCVALLVCVCEYMDFCAHLRTLPVTESISVLLCRFLSIYI